MRCHFKGVAPPLVTLFPSPAAVERGGEFESSVRRAWPPCGAHRLGLQCMLYLSAIRSPHPPPEVGPQRPLPVLSQISAVLVRPASFSPSFRPCKALARFPPLAFLPTVLPFT